MLQSLCNGVKQIKINHNLAKKIIKLVLPVSFDTFFQNAKMKKKVYSDRKIAEN